ncbi:MAG: ABC transporter ATP-binding protein [Bilifractor sp.]
MAAITLSHITKTYPNGFAAVKDFNLEIGSHEFIVFVGPSGCGKSTTLRMIAGLEEISKGELWIGNRLVNHMDPGKRNLAMVFQNYALYPNMTVYQNMAFALKAHKVDKEEIDRKVQSAAKMLKIDTLLDRRPSELSGGQKQRVAIGSAIVREADAYLLDEPLSNLDAKLRTQMRVDLKQIYDRMGATFIYVTHDQVEAMTLATRIVVMKEGTVQQVGTPQDIYEHPVNRFVAGFVGLPQMNFMEADLKSAGGKIMVDTGSFSIPLPERLQKQFNMQDGREMKVELGIRPENFFLQGDPRYAMSFEMEMRENLGSHIFLHGHCGGQKMTVRLDAGDLSQNIMSMQSGQTLQVFPDPDKIHLFDMETGMSINKNAVQNESGGREDGSI